MYQGRVKLNADRVNDILTAYHNSGKDHIEDLLPVVQEHRPDVEDEIEQLKIARLAALFAIMLSLHATNWVAYMPVTVDWEDAFKGPLYQMQKVADLYDEWLEGQMFQ